MLLLLRLSVLRSCHMRVEIWWQIRLARFALVAKTKLGFPHCKLKDQKEKTAGDIAKIAEKFFADPNVIPVAVCKAEKSQQTLGNSDAFHAKTVL